jgi:Protein of unknown function (DUF1553)/Protein of unknown function (DUF1549)/Planctomycete cytochrome C
MNVRFHCLVFASVILGVAVSNAPLHADPRIDFSRDIRPILSNHCYKCHGPDAAARQADLRLDSEESLRKALEPGAQRSELVSRITSSDPDEQMPPPAAKKPLSRAQIDQLQGWIESGAELSSHWAFEPLVSPRVPSPRTMDGYRDAFPVRNPIDAFVQAELYERGILPSPEASKETLLRRVTLDLTGLPPTPAELQAFLRDPRDTAYEHVVDRLLQSTAYGEQMAWHWLEAARYADTNGYQGDNERTMWPWRDWVIAAFNQNLPYDRFTIWQLAGDLIPEASTEQRLATGFCRNHMINGEGGRIPEENRIEYVMDMTETVGTIWLGLSLNCCRCHDHKFDPLTQEDYYRMFAFFNQTPVDGSGGDPQTPPILELPNPTDPNQNLKVMVMQDLEEPRPTFLLNRGQYNKPGQPVLPGVPYSLPQLPSEVPTNRLALSQWLVDDANPLTARVTVNRFWQQFFGVGLVKTVNDFGIQGEIPAQHELLDWLAHDFREHNWDVKRFVRQLVLSHTYRQSSRVSPAAVENDPENRWLARGPRFRLPAAMIRDQALAASGLLVRTMGGTPVRSYQPEGVWEEATFGAKKYEQDHGTLLYRRSLYTFWRRIVAPTMFFDSASRQTCTVTTVRTNTPLQALLSMNDTTFVEAARRFAEQILVDAPGADDREKIALVFQRLLSRSPTPPESDILLSSINRSRTEFRQAPQASFEYLSIGEFPRNQAIDPDEHAAWTSLVLATMNLDEALTKD